MSDFDADVIRYNELVCELHDLAAQRDAPGVRWKDRLRRCERERVLELELGVIERSLHLYFKRAKPREPRDESGCSTPRQPHPDSPIL